MSCVFFAYITKVMALITSSEGGFAGGGTKTASLISMIIINIKKEQ